MGKRSASWCFTDNENKEEIWGSISCQYIVYGREVAPTTGQKHLQGYIKFPIVKSFKQVKQLHDSAHWEPCKSGPASITYCKKDGDFYERGEVPTPGKRTDLADVYETIKTGASYADVLDAHPSAAIQYSQGIIRAIHAQIAHRSQDTIPEVHWFHGPTASGKSRTAFEQAGPDAYVWCATGKFWEGYTGQTHVIFDDFRPEQMSFSLLLRVLDRYRFTVETKGSSCPLAATHFWITTPLSPDATYTATNHNTGATWERENIAQLVRRCSEIRDFGTLSWVPGTIARQST